MYAYVRNEPCSRSASEKGRDTLERAGATSERGERRGPERGNPLVRTAGGPRGIGDWDRRRKLWGGGWGDEGLGEKRRSRKERRGKRET
jgi:hypothetical protein